MKRYSQIGLAAIQLCVILLLASAFATDYPLKINDAGGREVALDGPVEGIIVMNGDALEAVGMLGSGAKIIGLSDTAMKKKYIAPAVTSSQGVGKWNEPDYEMIGELSRDGKKILVITYSYPDKPYGAAAMAKKLELFPNLIVAGLDFYKPETMISDVEALGKLLNKEAAAQDFISWYNGWVSNVEEKVKDLSKPKLYVEWNLKGELSTLGKGSGFDGVVQQANGFNVARNLEDQYPKISWEWVISQKPEVIIKRQTQPSDKKEMGWQPGISQDVVGLEAVRNEIMARAGASAIPAISSNRVYIIDWDVMNGLDQVVGLTYLAKILHPTSDLDPTAPHREYLERLGLIYPEGKLFAFPDLTA